MLKILLMYDVYYIVIRYYIIIIYYLYQKNMGF